MPHKGSVKDLRTLWVIALLLLLPACGREPEEPAAESPPTAAPNGAEYRNAAYGFSVSHPNGWRVHEAPDHPTGPRFNIVAPDGDSGRLPYDHHTEQVTHVSIFPEGIPTEGVFGRTRPSTVDFKIPVRGAVDFVLEDGTPWATYAQPAAPPSSWNASGFLFARVAIQGLEIICLREGRPVEAESCDPMAGDTVVRKGIIDPGDRQATVSMLQSFRWTEPSAEAGSRNPVR